MSHTPGPWIYDPEPHDDGGYYIQSVDDAGDTIALSETFSTDTGDALANARLIAAAPDLLSALQYILDHRVFGPSPLRNLIETVIAKAEGHEVAP